MAGNRRRRARNITSRDLADYGNPSSGEVDINAAAAGLGVPASRISAALGRARSALTNTFLRGVSGRQGADSTGAGGPRGLLQAAFGRGPRGGAVDAKAAAQQLGVSQATVRRWARGTQRPTADHGKALATAARRVTSTKAGRRSLTADLRGSAKGIDALKNGAPVWVSGFQGPSKDQATKDDYCRERKVALRPGPEDIAAMLAAYEDGGERGLHQWLTDWANTGDNYLPGWEFLTIDDLRIGDR
ncbi:MAG: helix-turn-helix domain-containing protein [Actinomycetia bacterium]|nr:helix-turn-helix domain-containing protein [Actinomycetes bacterium]